MGGAVGVSSVSSSLMKATVALSSRVISSVSLSVGSNCNHVGMRIKVVKIMSNQCGLV